MFRLVTTPNPTFTILLILIAYHFAVKNEVLFPQYISLRLNWSLAKANSVPAVKNLVSSLVLLLLPFIRSRLLEPRMTTQNVDLWIASASLAARLIGSALLGFQLPAPLFFIALCIYVSGEGLLDSMTAYGTFTLPQGQSASAWFVQTTSIQTVSAMAAAPVWSWIFYLAIKFTGVPLGITFWIAGLLFGLALVGIRVLKVKAGPAAVVTVASAAAAVPVE